MHGYRIRRAGWGNRIYLSANYLLHPCLKFHLHTDGTVAFYDGWKPDVEDLLADDWEIIREGIIEDTASNVIYGKFVQS